MIGFITSTIDKPWTNEHVLNFEKTGSQRDSVQYNSYYNWRIKLTDKNTFLCSIKTNDNDYKNIYLFAVTRRLFYFVIFVPQLEMLKQLNNDSQIKNVLTSLPLTRDCLKSEHRETQLSEDVLILDGNCLLVKVNAPIDNFLFPRDKKVVNEEIKKKYALLNNLYFQLEKEYEGLLKILGEYNSRVEKRFEELKEKLKRILVRKGIRMGISIALAGVTGGLSLGLDALFDLEDVADINDVMDIADVSDMMGDAMDAMDVSDILDVDILDFEIDEMADINISDVGEGDDLLAEGYNITFGSSQSRYEHIDSIYNPSIDRAYEKLEYDVKRINEGNLYSWEDPDRVIEGDNNSIKYWEQAKSQAISQAKVDEAKQNYWDTVSKYCKESVNKKITGKYYCG